MICYYLNVQFQGQRVNLTMLPYKRIAKENSLFRIKRSLCTRTKPHNLYETQWVITSQSNGDKEILRRRALDEEARICLCLWVRLVACFVLRLEIIMTHTVTQLLGRGEITYSSARFLFLAP